MIGNITYEEMDNIIKILEVSNNNLKKILDYYHQKLNVNTTRIESFNIEVENYINYLKNITKINKDADIALKKLKDLNN